MSNDSGSEDIAAAGRLLGLEFTEVEWEQMRRGVEENRARYEALRRVPLDYRVAPAPPPVGAEPARTVLPRHPCRRSRTRSIRPPIEFGHSSVGELGGCCSPPGDGGHPG